jgi:Na+/H+ antiporter NhaD/arsenite permease-like protein
VLLALAILGTTYALLTLRRIPRWPFPGGHRPWVALAGGAAMVLAGVVPLGEALAAVDVDILLLLLGMLALAASLEVGGFFDALARQVVRRARSPRELLVGTMVASAVLSALVLNDAVVLLFTPVLVKAAQRLRADPMPFLAGEVLAANIGSMATPVGNPQNAYIALASGLGFVEFVAALLPLALLALGLAIAICLVVFRRSLAAPWSKNALATMPPSAAAHPRLTRAALAILVLVVGGFVAAQPLGWSIAHVAAAGGLAALLAAALLVERGAGAVARRVDGGILVFFVGLFLLIAGVRAAGISGAMAGAVLGTGAPAVVPLVGLSALLSNLVSNVPAVLLLAPVVEGAADPALWLALAASSTLAGNATLVGAAANVIVAETARALGAEFSVRRFMAAGLPTALLTLGLAVLLLR